MRIGWASALLLTGLASTSPALAQSTVPPKGEGNVSLAFQYYRHTGHFDSQGRRNLNFPTRNQVLFTQLDVGVTDTIGLNVSLPFIASKYVGAPFYIVEGTLTQAGPLDTGTYHGAFQDLRVEARRMFRWGPVAAAPFLGVSVPTHDYETVGEAVPGRHRRELQGGISASVDLDAIVPRLSVNGRYAYAALERVNGFPYTRSDIDLEGNYRLSSRVDVRGLVSWEIGHARPTIPELRPDWLNHDRFINSSFFNVGGGFLISMPRRLELYAVFAGTVRGRRGAHIAESLTIGVSRRFGGKFHGLGN